MTNEILSEWPVAQNLLFILFVLCFFVSMQFMGGWRRTLATMLHQLFRQQERESIFSQTVNNEFLIKLILCLQTILMSSVIIYCVFDHAGDISFETTTDLFNTLGVTALIILFFVIYKFLTNFGVEFVFFQRENAQMWNNLYFSIVSLSGIVLFIPALLIFYFPKTYYVCAYFALLYFLFVEILVFYKIFKIFFQQKSSLLYFILYLCTQEFLPVFFAYKALVYFYRT